MASVSASAPMPGRPAGHRTNARSPAANPPPQQPYAAIDLGTNNCRLLIARPTHGGFTVVDAFSRIVRLGEGLASSGRLTQDAMDRAVDALGVCSDKLRRRRVGLARSVATEACRRAANGRDFIERVREETGIALEIIPPQEEARLAVLGCHKLLEPGDGPAIIFDIGGGSTELVLVEPGDGPDANPRIRAWWSAPWGVVSLTESEGRAAIEGPDREKTLTEHHDADLFVTSYALLRRDEAIWREREFDVVILDEAQHIKNPEAQVSQAAHRLRGTHRFALTGTPVEN